MIRPRAYYVFILSFALAAFTLLTPPPVNAQEWRTAAYTDEPLFYEAVGTIQPRMTTTLSSKVMGNVLEVLKREGDTVKAGEVVLKIDAKDIASDLAGAQAGLSEAAAMGAEIERGKQAAVAQRDQVAAAIKMAESSFERIKTLYDKKSVSKQEYEQAETAVNSARAQLRAAEAGIAALEAKRGMVSAKMNQAQAGINKVRTIKDLAEVASPFSGRVIARKIEPGMLAAPGVPLMAIEDAGNLRFEAMVPESLIASISEGASVTVAVDALRTETVGQVAEMVPAGDPLSHTFMVKIAVPNEMGLKTGMYARGKFIQGIERVLLVPRAALEQRGQLDGLWVEQGGAPVFRLVRTGRVVGDQIEILTGLSEKERFLAAPPVKGSESK